MSGRSDQTFPLWRLLDPRRRTLRLVGREEELAVLHRWWQSSAAVAVQIVTGGAGVGKTRLATELIARVAASNPAAQDAGFVSAGDWSRLAPAAGGPMGSWQRPTLLVIDNAAIAADHLRRMFAGLAAAAPRANVPLRILLLERHGTPEEGWLRYVQEGSPSVFDKLRPIQLGGLPSCLVHKELRETLGQAMIDAGRGAPARTDQAGPQSACEKERSDGIVTDLACWIMAEVLGRLSGIDPGANGRRSRVELADVMARLELDRLAGFAPPGAAWGGRWMLHLAACATVLGGVSFEELVVLANDEQRALHWDSPDARVLAECLQRALPAGGDGGVRIADELVGGAIVLRAFGRQAMGEAGREVLRRLASRRRETVAPFLARVAAHFAGKRFPESLDWIAWLLGSDEPPTFGWLLEVERILPAGVPGLRDQTLRLSERLLTTVRLQSQGSESSVLSAECARMLGRFSWRLAEAGHPEVALDAAQQAERLCCRIAAVQPERYRGDWAQALEVLAVRLSEAGQTEAAAETIGLVEAGNNATQGRARMAATSLVASGVLARSGQRRRARDKTAEAVELYRGLASEQGELYLPRLMACQSRLAVLMALSGETEEAVRVIKEAGSARRSLSSSCPAWALAAWATALGLLARHLRCAGLEESSLCFGPRAADAWRRLALQEPGTFLPDLGRALCHWAEGLEQDGRGSEARALWAEAEEVYGKLAQVDPCAFLPDLALTLLRYAIAMSRASQWETALRKAREAESMFQPLAEAQPASFLHLWARALSVEGTCYEFLPDRAGEIDRFGRSVMLWCAKQHHSSTLAGAIPEPLDGSSVREGAEPRGVAG